MKHYMVAVMKTYCMAITWSQQRLWLISGDNNNQYVLLTYFYYVKHMSHTHYPKSCLPLPMLKNL